MERLTKLANRYHTDKGTSHWYAHGFTDFYEPYFKKYENPTILEIGTADGASAKMLNDFYDGECTIYTLDIVHADVETENIHFFQIDSSNVEEIDKLLNGPLDGIEFDIIIDDASHLWDHQMINIYFFGKRLKKTGIYVMEDIHTSYQMSQTGKNYENSPLYFLNFFEGGFGLYEHEKAELVNSIKDVVIFNRYNEKNEKKFKQRSITAIITFK